MSVKRFFEGAGGIGIIPAVPVKCRSWGRRSGTLKYSTDLSFRIVLLGKNGGVGGADEDKVRGLQGWNGDSAAFESLIRTHQRTIHQSRAASFRHGVARLFPDRAK
jgi:hypothetical protein